MSKIEKSVRAEMRPYGPALRAGHYAVPGGRRCGDMPKIGYINSAHMDVEGGVCTDIRVYAVGEAMERRDYHGESANITDEIQDYLEGETDWNGMIRAIADVARAFIR